MFSDWLPSNLKQPSELLVPNPEPPPDPTLILPNPNPSDEDKDETMGTLGDVAMEWGTEEQILAPQLNTSQNSSTSAIPTGFLCDDADKNKKREPEYGFRARKYGAHRHSSTLVLATSSQIDKEEEKTDKIYWELPCKRPIQRLELRVRKD